MRASDGAWLEALERFESDVNPENGLHDDQVEHFRRRLLGLLDDLAEETGDHEGRAEALSSALVAVDAGVYGICLRCHRPIGFSTLSVEPATRICPACDPGAGPVGTTRALIR